jgi:DGQHR domain-containing protein
MEVRVHKYLHQGQEIYLTVLSGKTVAGISDVDSVDKDVNGYQRPPNSRRIGELKEFIEMTEGLVPGAILLNVRPEKAEELRHSFSKLGEYDGVEFGSAELPNEKFAWIMDAQHRTRAFEAAAKNLLVPVVMTIGMSRAKEAETFNIVNSKQKNVSASLQYYDLARYASEDVKKWAERDKEERHDLAYAIILDLSQNNVWKDRINFTGVRGMKRAINLKGFMDGLDSVVWDEWFFTRPHAQRLELMRTFWSAMNKTWPVALAPNSGSILTKTFGVHVACGMAVSIFHYCDQLKDSSEKMMMQLLEPIKPEVEDWNPEGKLAVFIGGGRRNVRLVTEMLRTEIRKRFDEILSKSPVQPA